MWVTARALGPQSPVRRGPPTYQPWKLKLFWVVIFFFIRFWTTLMNELQGWVALVLRNLILSLLPWRAKQVNAPQLRESPPAGPTSPAATWPAGENREKKKCPDIGTVHIDELDALFNDSLFPFHAAPLLFAGKYCTVTPCTYVTVTSASSLVMSQTTSSPAKIRLQTKSNVFFNVIYMTKARMRWLWHGRRAL